MKKLLAPIGGLILIIGALWGVYNHLDTTFAKCAEVQEMKQDMRLMRLQIQQEAIDRRMWVIKERHGEEPKDKTVREELTTLQEKNKTIQKQIEKLERK